MTIPPDQQVALANQIMRQLIAPNLPPGIGASLMLFPLNPDPATKTTGMVSYISNANRADIRVALLRLLAAWDEEKMKADGLFDSPPAPGKPT